MSELQLKLIIRVAFFALLLPLASADCVDLDLGMENGAIPDSGITASSELSANTPAKNGRLSYTLGSSWCAGTSDTNPYLQVHLPTLHIICAVSTQGNSQEEQWVKNYTIKFSNDGTTWTSYKEGGKIKTFQGNGDRSSEVKHVLYESVRAHYLQILPNAYHGAKCIRMEMFGVRQKPVNVALGKATFQASTFNNTQLGVSGVSEKAVDGNSDTEFRNGSCTHTQPGNPSWWRVDLGSDKVAVSDIFIVNRFSVSTDVMARSENYNITLGNDPQVVNNPQCKGLYSFVNFTASAVCFTNPLTTGRYVGITIERQFLQLCEVEIYLRDNLAFRKQTSQCSEEHGGSHIGGEHNPWWRVDLGQVEPVSEVYLVSQAEVLYFEIRVGTVPDNGGITNPRCGDKQNYSLPQGKGVSFFCRPVLFGRYVTIRSLRAEAEHFTLGEVEVYSERRACQMQAIGLASNDTLPDASFSASSKHSGFEASGGRLKANVAWLPASTNGKPDHYLQIDLQYEFLICAVATQGSPTSDYWTTEYRLQLSFDSSNFVTYKENNVEKIFRGNSGRDDIVKHNLKDVRARFIRFQPVKSERNKALRVEVYGVLISKVPSQAPNNFALSANSSTSITASWQLPPIYSRHGIIAGFKLFYKKKGFMGSMSIETINGAKTFSEDITGLEKFTEYEFQMLAFTSHGDGPNSSVVVERTMEDEPSGGPADIISAHVNKTTLNISWAPLPREQSNGDIVLYNVKKELLCRGTRQNRSSLSSKTVNTTNTFILLSGLLLYSQYQVSVRAHTKVGPGPYGPPVELPRISGPPRGLTATNFGATQVTLEWKEPELMTKEGLSYRVKYLGTKPYNGSFREEGFQDVGSSTSYTVKGLVPGSIYEFQIIVKSLCGLEEPKGDPISVKTNMTAPISPAVLSVANKRVSTTTVVIHLWPAEQRNGPVSSHQVIVLNIVDGVEDLPIDYASKLKDSNKAEIGNLSFYVAAEIENVPGNEKSWEFTVGDGKTYGAYRNKELQIGEDYTVFQRAMTYDNGVILEGPVSKVAKISIIGGVGVGKSDASKSVSIVPIVVPVVLVIVLVPLLLVAILVYRRRRQAERSGQEVNRNKAHVPLGEFRMESVESSGSAAGIIYQNVSKIPSHENVHGKASLHEEKEAVYCEADDGKPKPIPVSEFAKYFKDKSANGAIVLEEEFKKLPSILPFSWDVGKDNKVKNRYGNITTYDHSRVVLEKIEGDPKSDYINASYIPTFDAESVNYIATQGPTSTTISDFWRMIWQENCFVIVMLTDLVEQGKNKCDQYWPDSTTMFGSISVTLIKTQNFADYCIRTLKLMTGTKTREVYQYHFTSWPDRGVPHHSTALLGFRWKVHAQNQTTGGPLVVHCSAGVGRTGAYIAIDAMLEGAKKKNTVFIHDYVQVMRKHRPFMVQNDVQYVFIHQAVMEALTCGTTEVASQDLRIRMNKLARVLSDAKHTGYAEEFKRLEIVSGCQSSGEEFTEGFKPSNLNKNRFSNIVPMDTARVMLRSSEPNKDYINASFVDDYSRRNAYILTQAPLNNTVVDFWRMISQYDIGTVVMLNSLKEEKESYPQYWPSEGSAKYGDITLQLLSKKTAKNITTSKLSVTNAMLPEKTSTVQHIQLAGWANGESNPDPQEILDLLTVLEQSQQQSGDGVIVFQCSDGVGRSGCLATIMSVIERVKIEQTVDVFKTIKLIRAKRPGAVNTLDLYSFCYKTTLAYLDSFNCYSNFADF